MNFVKALHLSPEDRALICLVGAGGKTTTMFNLATALKDMGQKVLVTTTTKIFHPAQDQYDRMILNVTGPSTQLGKSKPGTITCLGKQLGKKDDKIIGIDKESVDRIYENGFFDAVLVEGDGAREKPIKAPGVGEPVIPEKTTLVLGVIGLDALGKPVNDKIVHRCLQFCAVTGAKENDIIEESVITRLITSPSGLFKNVPKSCRRMVLLNKADLLSNRKAAMRICQKIETASRGIHIAITSAQNNQVFQW